MKNSIFSKTLLISLFSAFLPLAASHANENRLLNQKDREAILASIQDSPATWIMKFFMGSEGLSTTHDSNSDDISILLTTDKIENLQIFASLYQENHLEFLKKQIQANLQNQNIEPSKEMVSKLLMYAFLLKNEALINNLIEYISTQATNLRSIFNNRLSHNGLNTTFLNLAIELGDSDIMTLLINGGITIQRNAPEHLNPLDLAINVYLENPTEGRESILRQVARLDLFVVGRTDGRNRNQNGHALAIYNAADTQALNTALETIQTQRNNNRNANNRPSIADLLRERGQNTQPNNNASPINTGSSNLPRTITIVNFNNNNNSVASQSNNESSDAIDEQDNRNDDNEIETENMQSEESQPKKSSKKTRNIIQNIPHNFYQAANNLSAAFLMHLMNKKYK